MSFNSADSVTIVGGDQGEGAVGSATSRVTIGSKSYADSARNAYASVNVTTSAWVQLIAATAATINSFYLFDSSGETLELGVGGAGLESRVLLIPPGGLDGLVPIRIVAGSRVAIKAISATANSGEIVITGLS